ncbi:MAG: hypothetical protein IH986_09730 [Planctomycetes bacterium]|nr:hypothetical protein [Planctomycetota bacterium]
MSIQFECPSCSQPIEVDDEYAGQTAACPYCRKVVSIPSVTTLAPRANTAARPMGPALPAETAGPSDSAPLELHLGPKLTPRQRAALSYANYGLICSALTVLIFAGTITYELVLVLRELGVDVVTASKSAPTREEISHAQEVVAKKHLWLAAGPLGAGFFAIVGLALGIASLRGRRKSNWRAIVTVVICGMTSFCWVGGMIIQIALG